MQHLDLQVIEQALQWARQSHTVWLCTVLNTFGSSPRAPGAMLVARSDGQHLGSLSGGCIEEDFLERLQQGKFNEPIKQVRYGAGEGSDHPQVTLPCGGQLDVLVEKLSSNEAIIDHLETLRTILVGHAVMVRIVDLITGERRLEHDKGQGAKVAIEIDKRIAIRIGPSARLIIAGMSSITPFCAQFAQAMGFEVIICDARDGVFDDFSLSGVRLEPMFPANFIQQTGHVHGNTAIVALTHDPRIDDLAMIEAVDTSAFYLGVMGSMKTSKKRAERLTRVGGLDNQQMARIHMPIGLNIGSKTPAEIALSVMADILRVQRGIARDDI